LIRFRVANLRDTGPDVHRGYSWPGLEKVSQNIYAAGDEEKQVENRRISDVKVCLPPTLILFSLAFTYVMSTMMLILGGTILCMP
jgi:hypothetical protein